VLNDLEAPPKAAISPTPGLSMRQTVSRSTKEVSSLPTEILQKAATDKAQRSTKEVQTHFSATVSEGRNSDTLADSKKVLPREIVSEMQSIEIRAPDPFSALMPGARWKEQSQVRSIFGREVVESVQSPQSSSLNVTTASATTAAVPLQSPTDVYVAEQVSYWISRDVQNAEMKLEGFGSDPVQVNISMNGNEAQVAFRTDELQVRNALENASAHLREMLEQEGVTLSGVSVGSSGAGESGNQEEKQRHGVKQMSVLAAQALQPAQRRDPSQVAGRSLDLFV
jgi:flagellar hook-length control protein FliK